MTPSNIDPNRLDRPDRRGFLQCMAWLGTGVIWTVGAGGVLSSCTLPSGSQAPATSATPSTAPSTVPAAPATATGAPAAAGFSFVQISDNHVGFSAEGVNTDVTKTLQDVVDRINALPQRPSLVLHTGDVAHLSKPAEFDTAAELLKGIKTDGMFFVPGEHDVIGDHGAGFRERFVPKDRKQDWYSFDQQGIHFVGLWNSGAEDEFGVLGENQLDWLQRDLSSVGHDTPVVVFAHVPLYAVYPAWGWTTKDAPRALDLLKPFSSVTVLNGHIHQIMSQTEGSIRFHTAYSTAFPQHRPGEGDQGAYKLPADELLRSLGYRSVTVVPGSQELAVADHSLAM